MIRLINQEADLCDQMKNIDEECPLEGEMTITKNVDLPKEIPRVRYAMHSIATLLTLARALTMSPQTSTPRIRRR